MRPTVAQLETLVALAHTGSISAAAAQLGVAQPTASATLARFERQAGVTLVTREPSGTRLTDAGEQVCQTAIQALASVDAVGSLLASLAQHPDPVRIAASYTIAEHMLPAWLAHSPQSTQVEVCNSQRVQEGVLAGAVDLGFIEGADTAQGLHSQTLAHDRLLLIVGPAHPWAARGAEGAGQGKGSRQRGQGEKTRRDESSEQCRDSGRGTQAGLLRARDIVDPPHSAGRLVLREEGSGARQILARALAQAGQELPDQAHVLGSNAAILTAVELGDAYAFVAEAAAASAIETGRVVSVPTALHLERELRIITARSRLSAQARSLASHIIAAAGTTAPRA